MADDPDEASRPAAATRSLIGLSLAVMILLGIAAVFALLAAIEYFDRAELLPLFRDRPMMIRTIETADAQVLGSRLLFGVLFAVTGAVFIGWQYRHAANAVALRGPLGLGPGWAIGGWFVPVGNLVLPFLQLAQAAKASDPRQPPGSGTLPWIQLAWSGTYVAAALLLATATWISPGIDSYAEDIRSALDTAALADRLSGIGLIGCTLAGVLAIGTVRVLTRRQRHAIAQLTT